MENTPVRILPVEKLLGRLLHIVEIREDVPTKFRGRCTLYVIDAVDDKPITATDGKPVLCGFFNGRIGRQYLQAGDKIRLGLGKTITGSRCVVLTSINNKLLET